MVFWVCFTTMSWERALIKAISTILLLAKRHTLLTAHLYKYTDDLKQNGTQRLSYALDHLFMPPFRTVWYILLQVLPQKTRWNTSSGFEVLTPGNPKKDIPHCGTIHHNSCVLLMSRSRHWHFLNDVNPRTMYVDWRRCTSYIHCKECR